MAGEEQSEALFYHPGEQAIYEILTEEEVRQQEQEDAALASAQQEEQD